ncbi:unnamed protein product [Eruca vesicaria subsp. sativa]|uniref:F-box domain-containing protein n=1 Tax=Eruca vesicaria subsp. sativa TaxID=29727 RepID=A0ABC8JYL6_ERUVS|nr:unnamed protein product [Eruca vesicaria subsp. sativa]
MSAKIRSKKKKSSEPPSLIPSLPEDIILDILARVESCYYPTLSLVSKHFRSLVTSHELAERRSLLGCKEHRLYVALFNIRNCNQQLYSLREKANGSHRLFLVPSVLKTPFNVSFVAVGSSIYVFSKFDSIPPERISAKCSSQRMGMHTLPGMNVTMYVSFAYFMDGKIYVNGYSDKPLERVMAVFNIETQVWEPKKELPDTVRSGYKWNDECVVMAGKMYTRDPDNRNIVYVYEPKENKWERDNMLNRFNWEDGCVVGDVLYYFDGKVLRAYDPKERKWLVVNGLEELVAETRFSRVYTTGSCGGKLVLFFSKDRRIVIWCAQISLERRHQGSEIWGKVEWCEDVLVGGGFYALKSLDVIV